MSIIIYVSPFVLSIFSKKDFATEKISGCTYDFLALYDGPDNSSRKIEQLCGQLYPNDVTSTGRHLYLHFESDIDVAYVGFNLTYKVTTPKGKF